MSDHPAAATNAAFQYASRAHQSDTAISGMWLFLATELLFFGGLFLLYIIYRHWHPAGFALASRHAELWIGTVNTALLITSSAVFSYGLANARQGNNRPLFWALLLVALLGATFLVLKGWEWKDDFDKHLFPGVDFGLGGSDVGGAQIFYSFYFVATALHGIHMLIGLGMVAWIMTLARRDRFSQEYSTPVEAVSLYWSFVDIVWLVLYPLIYLAGHITP